MHGPSARRMARRMAHARALRLAARVLLTGVSRVRVHARTASGSRSNSPLTRVVPCTCIQPIETLLWRAIRAAPACSRTRRPSPPPATGSQDPLGHRSPRSVATARQSACRHESLHASGSARAALPPNTCLVRPGRAAVRVYACAMCVSRLHRPLSRRRAGRVSGSYSVSTRTRLAIVFFPAATLPTGQGVSDRPWLTSPFPLPFHPDKATKMKPVPEKIFARIWALSCPSHSGWHGPGHGPGHGNSEARWSDGVRTQRDAPGRGPRCHCGPARPALVALRAAATSARVPRAHPRCRRARAVKPCRPGAHGPASARPGKGASEHGQANNGAWLNNDTWPRADGQVVAGRTGAARPRTRSRTMWPS